MLLEMFLLLLGLVVLVKGADYFVDSASMIAKKLGVSEFVIGLTLVALGTSIPELASSITASFKGAPGLVIGNIVGSNIANIGLIVGLAASMAIIRTNKEMLSRDGYVMILASFLFYFFSINGIISRTESIIFLVAYCLYMFILISRKHHLKLKKFFDHPFNFQYMKKRSGKYKFNHNYVAKKLIKKFDRLLMKHLGIFIISAAAVVYGSNLLVNQAMFFANLLKISDTVIGLSLIALGTSLPELTVTISAARKGHSNIAIGNVIGSNIANVLLVLGISGLVFPLAVEQNTLMISGTFMLFISLLLIFFIRTEWKLRKWEGVVLLGLYFLFVISSFFLL